MLKREITCDKCRKEVKIPLLRLKNEVVCQNCGTKYLVIKSSIVSFIQMLMMFMVGFSVIDAIENTITAAIVCLIAMYGIVILCDCICIYILRIKKYDRIERK